MTQTKTQSNFRWRWGETNPVIANVEADTVIHIGDLLYLDGNNAHPVSDCDPQQYEFALLNFLGVAMQASLDGSTTPIRVATSGTFQPDTLIPVSEQRLGMSVYPGICDGRLMTQSVGAVCPVHDDRILSIGRISHVQNGDTGTAFVRIRSVVFNL